jgi:hypothetical protein
MGIRLADYVVAGLCWRGWDAELIDAKAFGLPMLERMCKEQPTEDSERSSTRSPNDRFDFDPMA